MTISGAEVGETSRFETFLVTPTVIFLSNTRSGSEDICFRNQRPWWWNERKNGGRKEWGVMRWGEWRWQREKVWV